MTYLTIPTPARALAHTVTAEMSTVRQALGGAWTTPEALERAEQAAERMRGQLAALRIEIRRISNDPTIPDIATGAARLARENWTPPAPEPVDPDILAFWEWVATSPFRFDEDLCEAFLAGARIAREQETERFNHPVAFAVRVMAGAFKDLDSAKREAREALARIPGRASDE